MIRFRHSTLVLLPALLLALLLNGQGFVGSIENAQAADPVVRAVLFFSPTCGHCEKVITEVLPPLFEQYNNQLDILQIDVTQPEGQQLFQDAVLEYQITEDRLGVPTLIFGETVLVGSREILEQLPGLIESGLVQGGIDWPALPGLAQAALEIENAARLAPDENVAAPQIDLASSVQAATEHDLLYSETADTGIIAKFTQDIVANSLAVVVLLGMLLSGGYVAYAFLASSTPRLPRFPTWAIPLISVLGLGVALYLSYIELFQAEAICGPVGNCNAVQNSPYAYLFGVIPVGVLGALSYVAILTGWLLTSGEPKNLKRPLNLAIWGLAWIGLIFSIYLTFLEPFVIGATCMWCLSSAILMTLLLWATTPAALQAMQHSDDDDDDELEPEIAA